MRTSLKTLIAASTLVAGIATAPALYAQSTEGTPDTQTSPTAPCNTMAQGATMNQGTAMDMTKMMTQMTQMMKTHSKAMQSTMKDHGAEHSDKAPSNNE